MDLGQGFDNALSGLFYLAVVGVVAVAAWLVYVVILFISPSDKVLESKVRIIPDYKLEAKGKVVDTIFIYKVKK